MKDSLSKEKSYRNALLPLYIIDVLKRYSDENERLDQAKILYYLKEEHHVEITRYTLSKYLEAMRWQEKKDANSDSDSKKVLEYVIHGSMKDNGEKQSKISKNTKSPKNTKTHKSKSRDRKVYIESNIFNNIEISMLCDGVLYSKHIPQETKKKLISMLKNFSPRAFKGKYRYVQGVGDVISPQNDNIDRNLETIEKAISENRKIRIVSGIFVENKDRGEYEMVRGQRTYIVSPYYVVASLSRYYLICSRDAKGLPGNLRIDRMFYVEILDENRDSLNLEDENSTSTTFISEGDYLKKYMREHIYMYAGKSVFVTFRIRKEYVGHFIDWYGVKEIRTGDDVDDKTKQINPDYVRLTVRVNENAMYHWAIQYGELVEILSPKNLRVRVKEGLEKILNKYKY